MLKKRFYTFIVASHADAKLWRLCLPYPVLLAMGLFAAIGVLSSGIAVFHYGRVLLQLVNYNQLLAENDTFRSENYNYKIQTAQLGEKIDFLETTARKLSAMFESDKGVGGIGGFSNESFREPLPASAGDIKSIDMYNKSVTSLEDRYRALERDLSSRALVASTIPNIMPLKGYVTGGLGTREDPLNGFATDIHTGVDISAPYGSRVIAPADGTVIYASPREGYGNIIVIDHKFGWTTRYGHLSKFNVQVGQRISRHDVIGYVGTSGRTTGPHLHFEIWQFNKLRDPRKLIPSFTRGG